MTGLYRTIDAQRVIATAEALEARIADRFPESGLRGVCAELVALGKDIATQARALEGPIVWLRGLIAAVLVIGVVVVAFVMTSLSLERLEGSTIDLVQGLEASLNTILIAGLGMLTLFQLEVRWKRRRVFKGLHELRSMVHVIDMHQLTKDPAALSEDFVAQEHSPKRTLGAADLSRYLDYCSEMLSLTGKLAALYAQSVDDDVVINAVNDVEELATNLSRKIWQKITMIADRQTPKASPSRTAG